MVLTCVPTSSAWPVKGTVWIAGMLIEVGEEAAVVAASIEVPVVYDVEIVVLV